MRFRTCNPEMWRRGMENSLSRRNLRSGGCRKDPLTNPVCPDARLPGPGAKAHAAGGARRATSEGPERTGRRAPLRHPELISCCPVTCPCAFPLVIEPGIETVRLARFFEFSFPQKVSTVP